MTTAANTNSITHGTVSIRTGNLKFAPAHPADPCAVIIELVLVPDSKIDLYQIFDGSARKAMRFLPCGRNLVEVKMHREKIKVLAGPYDVVEGKHTCKQVNTPRILRQFVQILSDALSAKAVSGTVTTLRVHAVMVVMTRDSSSTQDHGRAEHVQGQLTKHLCAPALPDNSPQAVAVAVARAKTPRATAPVTESAVPKPRKQSATATAKSVSPVPAVAGANRQRKAVRAQAPVSPMTTVRV